LLPAGEAGLARQRIMLLPQAACRKPRWRSDAARRCPRCTNGVPATGPGRIGVLGDLAGSGRPRSIGDTAFTVATLQPTPRRLTGGYATTHSRRGALSAPLTCSAPCSLPRSAGSYGRSPTCLRARSRRSRSSRERANRSPHTSHAIAGRLLLTSASMTSLLDALERRGLVERHPHSTRPAQDPDPPDRRALEIVGQITADAVGRLLRSQPVGPLERYGRHRDVHPASIRRGCASRPCANQQPAWGCCPGDRGCSCSPRGQACCPRLRLDPRQIRIVGPRNSHHTTAHHSLRRQP